MTAAQYSHSHVAHQTIVTMRSRLGGCDRRCRAAGESGASRFQGLHQADPDQSQMRFAAPL